jgi:hypothetical protein
MAQNQNKTEKTRKKPVQTQKNPLTSTAEKPKVDCGTVRDTRINSGDFLQHSVSTRDQKQQIGTNATRLTNATRTNNSETNFGNKEQLLWQKV